MKKEDIGMLFAPALAIILILSAKLITMSVEQWLLIGVSTELISAVFLYWLITRWIDHNTVAFYITGSLICVCGLLMALYTEDAFTRILAQNVTTDFLGMLLTTFVITKLVFRIHDLRNKELSGDAQIMHALNELLKLQSLNVSDLQILRAHQVISLDQYVELATQASEE